MNKYKMLYAIVLTIVIPLFYSCARLSVYQQKAEAEFIYDTYCTTAIYPYLHCDSSALSKDYDLFVAKLNKPVSKWQYLKYAQEFISHTNNGHTRIVPDGDFTRFIFRRISYFTIKISQNDIYVNEVLTSCKSDLKSGDRIISINGISTDSIFRLADKYYSGETKQVKSALLQNCYLIDSWSLLDISGTLKVKYVNSNGIIKVEKLSGPRFYKYVLKNKYHLNYANNDTNRVFSFYDGQIYGKLAKLKYSLGMEVEQCGFNQEPTDKTIFSYWEHRPSRTGFFYCKEFYNPGIYINRFLDSVFCSAKKDSIENFVIDFRDNKGGDVGFMEPFVSYFFSGKFYYVNTYETLVQNDSGKYYVTGFGTKRDTMSVAFRERRKDPNFILKKLYFEIPLDTLKQVKLKNIYILTNRNTFSLGPKFACALKYNLPNIVAIGQPTDDLVCATANSKPASLPQTKFLLLTSKSYWESPFGYSTTGFIPDIVVDENEIENTLIKHLMK